MIKKNTLIVILSIVVLIFGISLVVFESDVLEDKKEKESNKTEITNKEEATVDKEEKNESSTEEKNESSTEEEKNNNDDNKEANDNEPSLDNSKNNDEELKSEKVPVIEIPNNSIVVNKKITIDNRCDITAQALEKIYEDNDYTYYLSTISSGCIYIKVNGNEYTLKKAINEKIVTVYELEENGFKFIKEERNFVTR